MCESIPIDVALTVQDVTLSHEPDVEAKQAEIVGLYLNPPKNAFVVCLDEKTAYRLFRLLTTSYL